MNSLSAYIIFNHLDNFPKVNCITNEYVRIEFESDVFPHSCAPDPCFAWKNFHTEKK